MSYEEDVLAVFDRLHDTSWPIFFRDDFWHTANTLDTCVDFVIAGSKQWGELGTRRQSLQQMIEASHGWFLEVYKAQNGGGKHSPDVWWDDYGWWGVTFAKIYQHFDAIFAGAIKPQITAAQCLAVARDCWGVIDTCSRDVNGSVQPPKKGPVEGGVWNHPPDDDGVQNTVTNALFLLLSARLARATKEQAFLQGTARQYLWFRDWFVNYLQKQADCPLPGKQQGLFRCLLRQSGSKLIVAYERPVDPANADYNQGNPPFCDGQLWTGDQGLLLSGLATAYQQREAIGALQIIKDRDPSFPQNLYDMAFWLGLGVTWLFDTTSVLHEAPLNGGFGTTFAADYATGKGVLMRNLRYAEQRTGLNYEMYFTASAKAVIANRQDNQVSFQWNKMTDSKIGTNESKVTTSDRRFAPTAQSAGLDVLNAAIGYLGK